MTTEIIRDYINNLRVWRSISHDRYHELLEVVPPARQSGRSFVMGEPMTSDIAGTHAYIICRRVYFSDLKPEGEYQYIIGTLAEYDSGLCKRVEP